MLTPFIAKFINKHPGMNDLRMDCDDSRCEVTGDEAVEVPQQGHDAVELQQFRYYSGHPTFYRIFFDKQQR